MRLRLFVIPWMMTMMACQNSGTDGSATDQGAECSKSPDMIASQPSCAAAKGLTGDNLLCVDFSNAQNTITNLTAQGWKFNAEATGNCAGWQVTNNLLQVNMFSMLSGSCALTLPSLTSSQIQQHSRLTLSIQHRLDLGDPQQQARIFLNDDTDGQNVLWQDTAQRNSLPLPSSGRRQCPSASR